VSRSRQVAFVVATGTFTAATLVHPIYPHDQPLHLVPVVVALALLLRLSSRPCLGGASILAIHAFLWLHVLGARYVYSFVPYDAWCFRAFGFRLSQELGFARNHYDRLVHFAYGALATVPQVDVLVRHARLPRRAAWVASFGLVLAAGAGYEIFEWALAMTVAPDLADRYNGQQGDAWDSQKDMACAAVGAIVATLVLLLRPPSAEPSARDTPRDGARSPGRPE
jgi:putative membrane protein